MPYKDSDVQRAYQNGWVQGRRAQWLDEHGPCLCGSWERLEVHHVDPAQKVTHRIWSLCRERRLAELAKCQPLCSECHKMMTTAQRWPKAAA